jgi:hypothetical protein
MVLRMERLKVFYPSARFFLISEGSQFKYSCSPFLCVPCNVRPLQANGTAD